MVNVRKFHLKKSYLVGFPEVGLPESISHVLHRVPVVNEIERRPPLAL